MDKDMKYCFAYKEGDGYKVIKSKEPPNKWWNHRVAIIREDLEDDVVYRIGKNFVIEDKIADHCRIKFDNRMKMKGVSHVRVQE